MPTVIEEQMVRRVAAGLWIACEDANVEYVELLLSICPETALWP
jgi:hypothetical protein